MGTAVIKGEAGAGRRVRSNLLEWRDILLAPDLDWNFAARRMQAHPQFDAAIMQIARYTLSVGETDPQIVRLMNDIQRLFVGFFVLYLDARGAITHAAIKQLCTELGFASIGRATAMLVHLRLSGFLIADPVQPDRRSRRYLPSPQTLRAFSRMFRGALECLAPIEPAVRRVAGRMDDPRIFKAFVFSLGTRLAEAIRSGDSNAVSLFDQRNAGLGILFRIAMPQGGDTYPARKPVPFSINALAGEFKVSRAHVRKLIRDAEARGLMHRSEDGTALTLEEPLRQALTDYQAAIFIGYLTAAIAALEAVGEAL